MTQELNLIKAMTEFTQHLLVGSITNGDRDLIIDSIIDLTQQLNQYKLDHGISLSYMDLFEE